MKCIFFFWCSIYKMLPAEPPRHPLQMINYWIKLSITGNSDDDFIITITDANAPGPWIYIYIYMLDPATTRSHKNLSSK